MIYLYCVTLGGITLFSSVTTEIFNYRHLHTVRDVVKKHEQETEIFLQEVNMCRKDATLERKIFE